MRKPKQKGKTKFKEANFKVKKKKLCAEGLSPPFAFTLFLKTLF